MIFQNAAVLGTGTLPFFCASLLKNQEISVTIYDMDEKPSGILKKRSDAEGIAYEHPQPKALFHKLSLAAEPTLIISAINPYLLPKYMLDNPHITAINCHQALLPRHPGRNAEMWAIFEGDSATGITWHVLTSLVDGGDILIQKSLAITENHTSYQIFREQIRLAEEGFREILPGLLAGTLQAVPQEIPADRKLHYSYEVPNDGWLDINWPANKISTFLRAMDYSILSVVPKGRIAIEGKTYIWKKYKITKEERFSDGITMMDDSLFIQKEGTLFELSIKEDF